MSVLSFFPYFPWYPRYKLSQLKSNNGMIIANVCNRKRAGGHTDFTTSLIWRYHKITVLEVRRTPLPYPNNMVETSATGADNAQSAGSTQVFASHTCWRRSSQFRSGIELLGHSSIVPIQTPHNFIEIFLLCHLFTRTNNPTWWIGDGCRENDTAFPPENRYISSFF